MPETEQTHAEWQAEQHHTAQEAAVEWATKAEAVYNAALKSEAYAKEHQDTPYLREAVANERVNADARQLAEMWARVATALAPSQAPANGEPATYDLHVALDTPGDTQQALMRAATQAVRQGRGRA